MTHIKKNSLKSPSTAAAQYFLEYGVGQQLRRLDLCRMKTRKLFRILRTKKIVYNSFSS